MIVKVEKFQGEVPKLARQLLPPGFAQTADNTFLENGNIVPYKDFAAEAVNLAKSGDTLSLYYYRQQYWFHWTTDVDVAGAPIADDVYDRVYWTGDGVPKMTTSAIATSGLNYPAASYALGLPAPADAPILAVNGTSTGNDEVRAYVYTYVSEYVEEGPPSDATIATVGNGQDVDLSGMSTAPDGNYNVAKKRIYRANTGTSTVEYQFVAEIDVETTTYNDSKSDTDLGEVMTSTDWVAPPSTMAGLTSMSNGVLAGFTGKRVVMCEPYYPHAWPYDFGVADDIVGLGAFGTTLLVLTKGTPYAISGDDPSTMIQERLEIEQACVSKRGIASVGYGVIYPSPDGLMLFGTSEARIATKDIIDRDTWQSLNPSSMIGVSHDNKYYGFYRKTDLSYGCIIFDPTQKYVVYLDNPGVTAAYTNMYTDEMYIAMSDGAGGSDLKKFNAGSNLTYTWKSGLIQLDRPRNFGAGQVYAESYSNLTAKFYAGGALKHTQTVTSSEPFRLPGGFVDKGWEIEVTGTDEVTKVYMGTTIQELQTQ